MFGISTVRRLLQRPLFMLFFCLCTCQFYECRRKRGSWQRFLQSPASRYSHPGSGHNFSWWTAGGKRTSEKHRHLEGWGCFCFRWSRNEEVKGRVSCRVRYSHPPSDWRVWIWCPGRAGGWRPNPTLQPREACLELQAVQLREEQRMHEGLRKRSKKKRKKKKRARPPHDMLL